MTSISLPRTWSPIFALSHLVDVPAGAGQSYSCHHVKVEMDLSMYRVELEGRLVQV